MTIVKDKFIYGLKIVEIGRESEDILMKILNDNKDTAYGIKYDFKNIKSIKEYQENVPISEYDDYIDIC